MPKNNTVTINEAQSLYTRTMLRWVHTSDPVDDLIDEMSTVLKMVEAIKKERIWPGKLLTELEKSAWQAKQMFVRSTHNNQAGVRARVRRELCKLDIDDFILFTWEHTPEWDGKECACQSVTVGFHDGVATTKHYMFTVRKSEDGYKSICTLRETNNSLLRMAANAIKSMDWNYILPNTVVDAR